VSAISGTEQPVVVATADVTPTTIDWNALEVFRAGAATNTHDATFKDS
jgi:hypothetical protein